MGSIGEWTHSISSLADTFPKQIVLNLLTKNLSTGFVWPNGELIYIPKITTHAIIQMNDDDSIEYCHCGNCNKTIEPYDRYCKHCGAKVTEVDVIEYQQAE